MAHIPTLSPERLSLLDRLVARLWWLIFLGGVVTGAAVGVVLALWLAPPPLPSFLLIVACWLGGNAAGWRLAAQTDAALTRRIRKHHKRKHAASPAGLAASALGFPRPQGAGWLLASGPVCP